jgi:hypothetical protein
VVIHHSGHSTQGDPRTVDEVRRILLEHIEKANCGQRPLRVTSPLQPGSTKPGVGAAPRIHPFTAEARRRRDLRASASLR